MPAKNALKLYSPDTHYHIYNRGVDKRNIFLDDLDFAYFLHILKKYFAKNIEIYDEQFGKYRIVENPDSLSAKVSLECYCLMPNHFHLLVYQISNRSIDELMRKVTTSYSIYFNKKYNRQGTLFQGRYKAVIIRGENQLIYLSKYIHVNPLDSLLNNFPKLSLYRWSSYADYIGLRNTVWLDKERILSLFSTNTYDLSYRSFIENDKSLTYRLHKDISSQMLLDKD